MDMTKTYDRNAHRDDLRQLAFKISRAPHRKARLQFGFKGDPDSWQRLQFVCAAFVQECEQADKTNEPTTQDLVDGLTTAQKRYLRAMLDPLKEGAADVLSAVRPATLASLLERGLINDEPTGWLTDLGRDVAALIPADDQ